MIKLDSEANVIGDVAVGDNYKGLCCDGFDCVVTYISYENEQEKSEFISAWMQCHNDCVHNVAFSHGDPWAGVCSKQLDDIVQHLDDAAEVGNE